LNDDLAEQVLARTLEALDDWKNGVITGEDFKRKLFEGYAAIEQNQWRTIEELRTRAPEGERELAREVADWMERQLRKDSGNA